MCYMVICEGWRGWGEKDGSNIVTFKQPSFYSGKDKCLVFIISTRPLGDRIQTRAAQNKSCIY